MTTGKVKLIGFEVWSQGRKVASYGPDKGVAASRRVDKIDNAYGAYIATRKAVYGPAEEPAAAAEVNPFIAAHELIDWAAWDGRK